MVDAVVASGWLGRDPHGLSSWEIVANLLEYLKIVGSYFSLEGKQTYKCCEEREESSAVWLWGGNSR